tara:strand:+ start:6177 stop:6974 length:798 start_codon:yes stop_codon:yes gene_type:complete
MNAFDIAWSLLKEDDTMIYDSRFKELSDLFRDRPVVSRQRVLPRDGSSFMPVLADSAEFIDREFAEGLARRMDTSPRKTPTKVIRHPEGSWNDRYILEDDEGNKYSQVSGMVRDSKGFNERQGISTANPTLSSLMSETKRGERRKGYYEKLLNTILQNNMNIHSTSRNYASEPFHQKFQGRLPPNIDVNTNIRDAIGRQEFVYMKDPIKESKQQAVRDVQGWGDLQPDYNTLPMVNFQDTIQPKLGNLFQQQYGTRQTSLNDFGQ